MTDIDVRIDRVESRNAIERLVAQYAHAFDSTDVDMLRTIWHDGAELKLGEPFGNFDRFIRRHGRWGMVERVFELHYFTAMTGWSPLHGSETAPLTSGGRGEV